MRIKIRFFGQAAEVCECEELLLESLNDTDAVQKHLEMNYPGLADFQWRFARNHRLINANESLMEGDELAVLPPFAGG